MYRISPSMWWTRYHLLGKKIERQGSRPTVNDVRLAAILTQQASRSDMESRAQHGTTPRAGGVSTVREAVKAMEWVLDYGKQSFEAELARRKAEALLGPQ